MKLTDILMKIDHTNLKPDTPLEEILQLCDQASKYQFASICIPPCYVQKANEYSQGQIRICSVVGFPLGYSTTNSKVEEAKELISHGACELDMVINIAELKNKEYDLVRREIGRVKNAMGSHILKVIIETCLLTDEEKVKMCEILITEGADYIKTSTGFASQGADIRDIVLFRRHSGSKLKIKAAGNIRSEDQAVKFIEAGADRIGMSSAMKAFHLD